MQDGRDRFCSSCGIYVKWEENFWEVALISRAEEPSESRKRKWAYVQNGNEMVVYFISSHQQVDSDALLDKLMQNEV